jgi:hypothetical protein
MNGRCLVLGLMGRAMRRPAQPAYAPRKAREAGRPIRPAKRAAP